MSALESAFSNSVIITSGEREIREIREIRGITTGSRSGSGTNTPTSLDFSDSKKKESAPQDATQKWTSGLRIWRNNSAARGKSGSPLPTSLPAGQTAANTSVARPSQQATPVPSPETRSPSR